MAEVAHAWRGSANPRGSAAPQSPCELAAAALSLNLVDAVVGGVATSSGDVLRAGLKYVGLLSGTRTVSISGFVEPVAGPLAGKLLIMTDTGAVIDPTVDQFVDIARNAVRSWNHVSDERPRIAFVTASTKGSLPTLPILDRVRRAVEILRKSGTEFDVDGELQLDAAVVPRVASAKGVGGAVAGRANILVFPGIDSCNIGYKIAEHIGGALTFPVTQGFARSFHDVSRGAEPPDLIGTCIVAAIMGSSTTNAAKVS
jgi:phosphotransacetylase